MFLSYFQYNYTFSFSGISSEVSSSMSEIELTYSGSVVFTEHPGLNSRTFLESYRVCQGLWLSWSKILIR